MGVNSRRYARVRYPWHAAIDASADGPPAFYASLIGNGLRSGRRTRYRFAPVWRAAARHPPPEALVARSVRALPRGPRSEIDQLLDRLAGAWPQLAARSQRLPSRPPRLSALALERSAGLTVFAFGEAPTPLLVAKLPTGDAAEGQHTRLAAEERALREAEPAQVAPRALGRVGGAYVQEAIEGAPLPLEALDPARGASMSWSDRHERLGAALAELAAATAKRGFAEELRRPVERALAEGGLSQRARRTLAAAWDEVTRVDVSVLRHHDASPENCLYSGGRLSGIIDWEHAELRGAPGFDVLNAALSYMELGVGLVRWSQERVLATFEVAWRCSDFWRGARAAAARAAVAAGVPGDRIGALETVFFGSRVGDRLEGDVEYPTGWETVRAQLELVCAEDRPASGSAANA